MGPAVNDDQPHLRQRFLTWLLARAHLWCRPEEPDHNGINGLVVEIEADAVITDTKGRISVD